MERTNEHCNAWDCPHNKDGYCESCEAFTECQDNLLRSIAAFKSAELHIGDKVKYKKYKPFTSEFEIKEGTIEKVCNDYVIVGPEYKELDFEDILEVSK